MSHELVILHGGALGDLVLTIQLALRLPSAADAEVLRVVSRTNPGDLSACRPSIRRQSSEGLGLHWLFGDHDDRAPERLRNLVRGRHVLSVIGERRLALLQPAALYRIDPQPRANSTRHITQQWQTQLEEQGLLVPKCMHQHPAQRGLGVPAALRERGAALLHGKAVLIHPGSGGRGKCWPLPNFVQVARRLREHAHEACFLIGEVEVEIWPAPTLDALAGEFPVLRSPAPDDLVTILRAARVLVSNDAGPAHLAALLGTPTVTIFGPTSASVWRPLGATAYTISGDPHGDPKSWAIHPDEVASLALSSL